MDEWSAREVNEADSWFSRNKVAAERDLPTVRSEINVEAEHLNGELIIYFDYP